MNDPATGSTAPQVMPRVRVVARLVLIAVQLILVFWFGQRGATFFYQGF